MNVVRPAKIPVWEKSKREKRKNRLVRLLVLLIFALVLINFAIKLPGIYKQINNPLPSFSGKDERTQPLDTSSRTNLLLISYESNRLVDAAVASFEPSDKKVTLLLFDLPNNKNIRLPANRAFREDGLRAISKYVSLNLGIILDRYLALENEDAYFTPESTRSVYKQIGSVSVPLKILSIRGKLGEGLKTNFSSRELLSLFWRLRGSELDEKDIISFSDLKVDSLQSEELATLVSNSFFDKNIVEESASITIRNSSGVSGAAGYLTAILTTLGASVIEIETGEQTQERSLLIVKNSKPKLEKRLSSLVKLDKKSKSEEDFAGDVLIDLGKNAAGELTLP